MSRPRTSLISNLNWPKIFKLKPTTTKQSRRQLKTRKNRAIILSKTLGNKWNHKSTTSSQTRTRIQCKRMSNLKSPKKRARMSPSAKSRRQARSKIRKLRGKKTPTINSHQIKLKPKNRAIANRAKGYST